MWHVAEGDLHAYLDGALEFYPGDQAERIRRHLETCDACRARLAEEAAVREAASGVLGMAVPGEVTPAPLEELRRRAAVSDGAGETPRRRAVPRRVAWAWAATVVMALGVGWGIGGSWLAPLGERSARSEVRPEEAVSGEASAASAERDEAEVAVPPSTAAPAAGSVDDRAAQALERARVSGSGEPAGGVEGGDRIEVATLREPAVPSQPAVTVAAIPEEEVAERRRATAPETDPAGGVGPTRARDAFKLADGRVVPEAVALTGQVVAAGSLRPIAGVQVSTRDGSAGTLTNAAGEFALRVPAEATTLVFNSIGYRTVEAPIQGQVNVELEQQAVALEGIVVTGAAAPVLRTRLESSVGRLQTADVAAAESRDDSGRAQVEQESLRQRLAPSPDPSLEKAASLALPGIEVVSVEWSEVAPGEEGVRVVQRLEDGTLLELSFVGVRLEDVDAASRAEAGAARAEAPAPAAPAPAAADLPAVPEHLLAEALPQGWHRVALPFRGGWVVVKGPLPEARLLALVEGMR